MASSSADLASAGALVETDAGAVAGLETDRGAEFLGIPYAAAPRLAPPGALAPWSGVRAATVTGPAAPQPRRLSGTFTHGELPLTDEQCLCLNVYTPSLSGRRPVLVWLHGGAFTVGHGGASVYRGGRLATDADVVVVTLNYRLGSLGWLCHPELAASPGAPFGNWGLLDQIAALQWVRRNIARFGGDPDRVTLAGQSAGGLSAWLLLAAPAARGLFQRAILQSPPLSDAWQSLPEAQRWALALSELAGHRGVDAPALRALSADRMVELHEALLAAPEFRGTRGGALPTVDGLTLPATPAQDPAASPEVPVLIGTTADEGSFFFHSPWSSPSAPDRLNALAVRLLGVEDPHLELAEYARRAAERGRGGELGTLLELATDAMFARPAAVWSAARAGALNGSGARVYRYRVDHPGAGAEMGATHCVEVPLLFGSWDDDGPGQRLGGAAPGAAEVAAALVTAWRGFIHAGDPGWAPLGAAGGGGQLGVFGAGPDAACRITDLNKS